MKNNYYRHGLATNFFIFSIIFSLCGIVNAIGNEQIIKSSNDHRSYRYLELDNKLRVVLVSDPQSTKSGASMEVDVGSFQDPKGRQGLAHFLEHMLFLGTSKYPDPSEYADFITAHGGHRNAFTANTHTNYYLSINNNYLEEALDRFSQFFISPLFNPELVDREINAIDNEYKLHKEQDFWRAYFVDKATANPLHPLSEFSIGNKDTLNVPSIREDLINFYESHYSANIMRLVVVSNHSIEELTTIVKERFKNIPNRNLAKPTIDVLPYTDKQLGSIVTVQTNSQDPEMSMRFMLPNQSKDYNFKVTEYIRLMLNNTSKGTLYDYLTKQNLITYLSCRDLEIDDKNQEFQINLSLTSKGEDSIELITKKVFQYISLISREGIRENIFNQLISVGQRNFIYTPITDAESYALELSENFRKYPVADILQGDYFSNNSTFDKQRIEEVLSSFTPNNLRKFLFLPNAKITKQEPWYQVGYDFKKLSIAQKKSYKLPMTTLEVNFPATSIVMPSKFNYLAKSNNEKLSTVAMDELPKLAIDRPELKLYFKQDVKYNLPHVQMNFLFSYKDASSNARNSLLAKLYASNFNDKIREHTTELILAGVSAQMSTTHRGLNLNISCYSDKERNLLLLMSKVMNQAVIANQERFAAIKQEIKQGLMSEHQKLPYLQAHSRLQAILFNNTYLADDYLQEIDSITLNEFTDFATKVLHKFSIESLIHGNISQQKAIEITEFLRSMFSLNTEQEITAAAPKSISSLKPGSNYWYSFYPKHSDTTLIRYFQNQAKSDDYTDIACNALLRTIMSEPIFDQLRTTEQLGYIVGVYPFTYHNLTSLFTIIESGNYDVIKLNDSLNKFMQGFANHLEYISFDKVQKFKSSLIANLQEPSRNLAGKTAQYWEVILDGSLDFNYTDNVANKVKYLQISDIKDYFQRLVLSSDTARVISVSSQGSDIDKFVESNSDISKLTDVDGLRNM